MRPSVQAFAADSCSDLLVFLLDMNNAPFVIDSVFISLSLIKGAYHPVFSAIGEGVLSLLMYLDKFIIIHLRHSSPPAPGGRAP